MKLTPSVIEKLADAMKNGAVIDVACNIAEVHRSTFFRWQKKAEQLHNRLNEGEIQRSKLDTPEKHLIDFHEKVTFASARYELELLKEIRDKVKNWQALAWILERRFRERYARRVMLDTEAFLKTFEREHGTELAAVLQQVLDTAEAVAASKQTYDEVPLQGKKLQLAAGQDAVDQDTQGAN